MVTKILWQIGDKTRLAYDRSGTIFIFDLVKYISHVAHLSRPDNPTGWTVHYPVTVERRYSVLAASNEKQRF